MLPSMLPQPAFLAASDDALLVRFGTAIAPHFHQQVRTLFLGLERAASTAIRNLHPAYASLLIRFDPGIADHATIEDLARSLLAGEPPELPATRTVEVPVCYGGTYGPDLADVSRHCGIAEDEVIARHCAGRYLVYFLGFSPGFPYLGGLDPALATPRLASPRVLVPAGSVAIGGAQTGIYPAASSGGWRLIGRTPLRFFDSAREPPCLLAIGDEVRFVVASADVLEDGLPS